jgi:hypothetical protein
MKVMKRPGLVFGFVLCLQTGYGQLMDLKELTGLLDLSHNKLEAHLQRKGFRRTFMTNEDMIGAYVRNEKEGTKKNTRCFQINGFEKDYSLTYQTTSLEEYAHLNEEIKTSGFTYPSKSTDTNTVMYQRQNLCIESTTKTDDSTVYYIIKAEKKSLPRKKDIVSADDLLQLDAQEYLIDVFGKENVKTDVFYFTETEANKCSVLFPNTNREAIFIWKDEVNLKGISFILVGGSLKTKESMAHLKPIGHNIWMSRQGVYCGMTLRELEQLNRAPVKFYNWKAESAGYLIPNNQGSVDFSRLGIVFNCLNCSFLKIDDKEVIDSDTALEENQKVYITTLIILPEKKSSPTASPYR